MKSIRKKQLFFLGLNLIVIIVIFLSLFIYDNYFRPAPSVYKRPLVDMEKFFEGENPYCENFDRMDLLSQYKNTRAVGSEEPKEMEQYGFTDFRMVYLGMSDFGGK